MTLGPRVQAQQVRGLIQYSFYIHFLHTVSVVSHAPRRRHEPPSSLVLTSAYGR